RETNPPAIARAARRVSSKLTGPASSITNGRSAWRAAARMSTVAASTYLRSDGMAEDFAADRVGDEDVPRPADRLRALVEEGLEEAHKREAGRHADLLGL